MAITAIEPPALAMGKPHVAKDKNLCLKGGLLRHEKLPILGSTGIRLTKPDSHPKKPLLKT
jgi:hypothetical protein